MMKFSDINIEENAEFAKELGLSITWTQNKMEYMRNINEQSNLFYKYSCMFGGVSAKTIDKIIYDIEKKQFDEEYERLLKKYKTGEKNERGY